MNQESASLYQGTLLDLYDKPLLDGAKKLRQAAFGNSVELCAIINIRSGNCAMDCKFCAQSRHSDAHAPVYGLLDNDELARRIEKLAQLPVKHIGLVASGPALSGQDFDRLCGLLASIPPALREKLCASLGRLAKPQLEKLKGCGLRRYHHNLETSRDFYPRICQSQSWESRLKTAQTALELGLELCCGGLFGLGESWEDRASLALSLKESGVQNVPLNFLDPVPGTQLAGRTPLVAEEALRIIAIFRHILPDATLRVCGGRLKSLGDGQWQMFEAGANALMTGDFLTTRGALAEQDLKMLREHGLDPRQ